jgi:hypothetical protein
MRGSRRSVASLVVLGLVGFPAAASATFHLMSISEVGAGFGGDPAVQFVELRLESSGQNHLTGTRLTAFAPDGTATELLLADRGVDNGAAGANVLYATSAFATATGVAPDFVIPAELPTPTGMVCWGAPGVVPPPPAEWDLDKPNNYVDCVAYGGFAAPTRAASGTASSLPAGDGTQSLTRVQGTSLTGNNAVDFALATPSACNNAGECSDLGGTSGTTCGDADGSGSVTVTDGVQTLRAAAGLSSPCTLGRCDVNGSGTITVTDGVQVLRGAAGLPLGGSCAATK